MYIVVVELILRIGLSLDYSTIEKIPSCSNAAGRMRAQIQTESIAFRAKKICQLDDEIKFRPPFYFSLHFSPLFQSSLFP